MNNFNTIESYCNAMMCCEAFKGEKRVDSVNKWFGFLPQKSRDTIVKMLDDGFKFEEFSGALADDDGSLYDQYFKATQHFRDAEESRKKEIELKFKELLIK